MTRQRIYISLEQVLAREKQGAEFGVLRAERDGRDVVRLGQVESVACLEPM